MQSRFISNNRFVGEQEEDNTPECGSESPPSSSFNDMKTPSALSSKKSRRAMQKRVVSVPIKDVEGSKLKGDGAPPSDSWAWRKYGQKPIKGSPYPRGYYRCSSSKGCPARKQVERSSVDPSMLLITYSCDHNHPWPLLSRSHHSNSKHAKPEPQPDPEPEREAEDKFSDLADDHALISASADEFTWFSEMETTTSTVLESPIFTERTVGDSSDVAMFFPMREEDESLFADLGELPECSSVFRHRNVGPEVQIC
ncbi:probable WRKY transcription factor 65 isoform X1 [Mangifera indica]|uniref:probable WRKY transcription factor 65 isoform X1 n=1 Tax=Mangifera indica TaxID=29780 RepID=UPI001CFB8BA5|nr:probable WRKY transcription factor 65 isoform X1 [Mangifera indica]